MQLRSDRSVAPAEDAARTETPMEWWFIQGCYEGERSGRREFMAALFRYRYNLPWAPGAGANAFSLILTVLDPSSGHTALLSQVDPATCGLLVTAARLAPPAGFEPLVLRAVADEVAEYGPPRPIRSDATPVELASAPFRAAWGEFELMQHAAAFALKFPEPESGRRCQFRLTPIHPRIHLADVAVIGLEAMDYVSYTRLALAGEVDGEAVRGQAWFDHQWGSQGWFVAGPSQERVLGWDWLGVQLDDGHDLLVMVHRDQRQGCPLCQYAVMVDETGPARLIRDFALTPTSWWTSPSTRTRYPIVWHLTMPELGVELDFEPYANDQEIPMLAPLRAVWEGAGSVAGTWTGRAVTGRARLELHGNAYLLDLRQHLDAMVQRIVQRLEDYLPRTFRHEDLARYAGSAQGQYDPAAQTAMLATPIWDLLDRGGKHWRPVFGFLMLDALGVSSEPYEQLFSITAEMLHGGALVMDDIEDNAHVRRGEECIHLRYGLDVALNAGSAACYLPIVILRDYPHLSDSQRLELYRVLSRLYIRAHLGQGQDIYWSKYLTRERLRSWMDDSLAAKIIQVYSQKAGSVVEAATEAACVIANAADATRETCADFGRTLGVAFQIVDDLVDFFAGRVAKGQGGCDLAEGKLTYVIFRALERLPESDRLRLETILCSPTLRHEPATLAEGIDLVRRSGALEICRQEARAMVEEQWRRLSAHLPPSEPKTMLRVLWSFLLNLGDDERNADFAPGN